MTVPVEGSEYIRLPIQVGDKGWVKAADAYLGGVSGLGGGVASLVRQGNLAALVFAPIGNTNFATVSNANAVTIYGVNGNGVTIYSDIKAKAVSIVLTNTNVVISIGTAVSMTLNNSGVQIVGNTSIQGNLSVNGNITVTGTGGGNTISVNGNVELTGAMTATGNITAGTGTGASVSLLGHEHTAPAGGGTTTAPIGGT